jgi:hypothetical protein
MLTNFFSSLILHPSVDVAGGKINYKKICQHCKGAFSQFFFTGSKAKHATLQGVNVNLPSKY